MRGFVATIRHFIAQGEKTIDINWINIPQYLIRRERRTIMFLRQELLDAGYHRISYNEDFEASTGMPQECWVK